MRAGDDGDQIARAAQAGAKGEVLFGPAVAKRLLRFFSSVCAAEA